MAQQVKPPATKLDNLVWYLWTHMVEGETNFWKLTSNITRIVL